MHECRSRSFVTHSSTQDKKACTNFHHGMRQQKLRCVPSGPKFSRKFNILKTITLQQSLTKNFCFCFRWWNKQNTNSHLVKSCSVLLKDSVFRAFANFLVVVTLFQITFTSSSETALCNFFTKQVEKNMQGITSNIVWQCLPEEWVAFEQVMNSKYWTTSKPLIREHWAYYTNNTVSLCPPSLLGIKVTH